MEVARRDLKPQYLLFTGHPLFTTRDLVPPQRVNTHKEERMAPHALDNTSPTMAYTLATLDGGKMQLELTLVDVVNKP